MLHCEPGSRYPLCINPVRPRNRDIQSGYIPYARGCLGRVTVAGCFLYRISLMRVDVWPRLTRRTGEGELLWRIIMDTQEIERPEIVTDEHLEYLDELRASGVTNMYGAPKYIQQEFDFSFDDACKIVSYWMKTFSQRKTKQTP